MIGYCCRGNLCATGPGRGGCQCALELQWQLSQFEKLEVTVAPLQESAASRNKVQVMTATVRSDGEGHNGRFPTQVRVGSRAAGRPKGTRALAGENRFYSD